MSQTPFHPLPNVCVKDQTASAAQIDTIQDSVEEITSVLVVIERCYASTQTYKKKETLSLSENISILFVIQERAWLDKHSIDVK